MLCLSCAQIQSNIALKVVIKIVMYPGTHAEFVEKNKDIMQHLCEVGR